jgi:hypothetical protein
MSEYQPLVELFAKYGIVLIPLTTIFLFFVGNRILFSVSLVYTVAYAAAYLSTTEIEVPTEVYVGAGVVVGGLLLFGVGKKEPTKIQQEKIDGSAKSAYNNARLAAHSGNIEQAFRQLDTAVRTGYPINADEIQRDEIMRKLRAENEKRFKKITGI